MGSPSRRATERSEIPMNRWTISIQTYSVALQALGVIAVDIGIKLVLVHLTSDRQIAAPDYGGS